MYSLFPKLTIIIVIALKRKMHEHIEIYMTELNCKTVGNYEMFSVLNYLHVFRYLILHSVVQLCGNFKTQLISTFLPYIRVGFLYFFSHFAESAEIIPCDN